MVAPSPEKPTWEEIGRSTTSPTENTRRKEVAVDDYYVVVGFEVNDPKAFVNDVQDLGIDYGHAFFYVVKNRVVVRVFSFGPAGAGKVGWFNQGNAENPNAYNRGAVLKNGYQNSRPGTADYRITDKVSAFKIPIGISQGVQLIKATDKARSEIANGRQRYTAYMNDTCAETARDIIGSAGIDTPSGSGIVRHSGIGIASGKAVGTPFGDVVVGFTAVNPYMWHKNFAADAKYGAASGLLDDLNPARLLNRADPFSFFD